MTQNKNSKELPKVVVKNLAQLEEALKPFKTEGATIRKLFIEGMDVVKRHSEFKSEDFTQNEDFGGFIPAQPAAGQRYSWVDTFIKDRLDAKREGLVIVWQLDEGRFEFDPWSMELKKTDVGKPETNS